MNQPAVLPKVDADSYPTGPTAASKLERVLDTDSLEILIPNWLHACLQIHATGTPLDELSLGSEMVAAGTTDLDIRIFDPDQASLIARAFTFAYRLHDGQKRKSGEPYISHPVAVADLIRDIGGHAAMIAAGFLHDVIEDTEITATDLEAAFGSEVSNLVEGVTKLSKFNFSSRTEQQAENFRRMFLAMAKDIRVIVVKLADRLHNMRTLQYLPAAKQQQVAQETKDIFAPLANRLGIWHFKWELEDLAFKYLDSESYRRIQELVNAKRTEREAEIKDFIDQLQDYCHQTGLEHFEISGRPKHLYSIYRKMELQKKEFHEIYDLSAVRVIVQSDGECYRVLAIVHNRFRPIPGRFKDYIGLPKANNYQSLHTTVIGPQGRPVEIQIRTQSMHQIAEYGIAAHWKYKESGHSSSLKSSEEKFSWLRQLLEWQKDLTDDKEYLDTIREDLFESEVYIFTPKGDLLALPRGSCTVDFAYRIHSEVGDHCAGARVNNKMVPLDTPLRNGDIVQIITQKNAHPSLDWLNFVTTSSARNRIRQWFKRSHREQNIQRGRHLLEQELGKTGFDALLKSDRMHQVAERLNYSQVEDLLAGLGHGEITTTSVVNRLQQFSKPAIPALPAPTRTASTQETHSSAHHCDPQSPIIGTEGLKHRLAQCCNPLPGDPIIGVVTFLKRDIAIHNQHCPNVAGISGERLLPVRWNQDMLKAKGQTYTVDLQLEVIDRVGVLKDVLMRLSDRGINVRNAQVRTFANRTAVIDLGIDVKDKQQLNQVMTQLKQMSDVLALRSPHQKNLTPA